jgi:hypothetical protein
MSNVSFRNSWCWQKGKASPISEVFSYAFEGMWCESGKGPRKNFEKARNLKSAPEICRYDLLLGQRDTYLKNVLEENNIHSHTGVIVECKDFAPDITIKYAKDSVSSRFVVSYMWLAVHKSSTVALRMFVHTLKWYTGGIPRVRLYLSGRSQIDNICCKTNKEASLD